jgi:hypothetical protein
LSIRILYASFSAIQDTGEKTRIKMHNHFTRRFDSLTLLMFFLVVKRFGEPTVALRGLERSGSIMLIFKESPSFCVKRTFHPRKPQSSIGKKRLDFFSFFS